MFVSAEFRIKYEFLEIIENIYQSYNIPYFIINLVKKGDDVLLKNTIKELTKIEKYVDNLLKSSI